MRFKEYTEDFQALPHPVKWTIYFVIGVIFLICVYQGVSNYAGNRKIERLEKENTELIAAARTAEDRAKQAETQAANEAANRLEIEKKLKILDKESKKQDEKIISQSKKSNNLRDDLRRVRVSKPRDTSTERLEQRLKDRYGQAERSQ